MNALASSIIADIDAELSNVIPIKPGHRPNADKLADLHRKESHNCQQRIAATKRGLKADLATFAASRKAEKARHDAAMLSLSEDEAWARQRAAEAIAEDERLAKYNRAAIDALAE